MKKKIVSFKSETLPRISLEETEKLVAALPENIDTSDIPEWTEAQFKSAERGRVYSPRQSLTTSRLDV